MRRRRARGALRWTAIAGVVLLLVLWMVNMWAGVYVQRGSVSVEIAGGAFEFWKRSAANTKGPFEEGAKAFAIYSLTWDTYLPLFKSVPGSFDAIVRVPIWIPLVLLGGVIALLWWFDKGERRRRGGLCPACAYDRDGLTADAKCPECGTTPIG